MPSKKMPFFVKNTGLVAAVIHNRNAVMRRLKPCPRNERVCLERKSTAYTGIDFTKLLFSAIVVFHEKSLTLVRGTRVILLNVENQHDHLTRTKKKP